MITLNHILPDRDGIDFTSHFDEEKEIVIKFIDPYTRLCYWGTKMNIFLADLTLHHTQDVLN